MALRDEVSSALRTSWHVVGTTAELSRQVILSRRSFLERRFKSATLTANQCVIETYVSSSRADQFKTIRQFGFDAVSVSWMGISLRRIYRQDSTAKNFVPFDERGLFAKVRA